MDEISDMYGAHKVSVVQDAMVKVNFAERAGGMTDSSKWTDGCDADDLEGWVVHGKTTILATCAADVLHTQMSDIQTKFKDANETFVAFGKEMATEVSNNISGLLELAEQTVYEGLCILEFSKLKAGANAATHVEVGAALTAYKRTMSKAPWFANWNPVLKAALESHTSLKKPTKKRKVSVV